MRRLVALFLVMCLGYAAPVMLVKPDAVYQGNSYRIHVFSQDTLQSLTLRIDGVTVPLYRVSTNNYQVFVGTSYDTRLGRHKVRLLKNGVVLAEKIVTVNIAFFKKETIIVSDQKQEAGATNFDVLASENEVLGKALSARTVTRYWVGKFIRPVKSFIRISSSYGDQRVYKSQKGVQISEWAHRGVDYAVPMGTPVYAPNAGLVTVSRPFQVHGDTIVLDHGQGIISVYNHLQDRLVTVGQIVKAGQLIGHSGNSGLTSGPHLHYGLSVNNTRVNPWEWFEQKKD